MTDRAATSSPLGPRRPVRVGDTGQMIPRDHPDGFHSALDFST